ncbi:MAG: ABC transporter permease, partial [Anaerolineae bacterium]|nr:ABC transporter permease [Anaerolineae bacterium]
MSKTETAPAPQKRPNEVLRTLKLLARNRIGLLGLIIFVLITFMSLVGPLIVPPETQAHVEQIYQPPSAAHPLGTDFQGREMWKMVIHGGRDVLIVAFLAGILTTLVAVTVGAASAFFGGWVDSLLMSITDMWLTIPRFLLL